MSVYGAMDPDDSVPQTYALPSDSPPPDSQIDPTKAIQYWNDVPTSLAGIMGGYPQLNRIDIQSSANFLTKLGHQKIPPSNTGCSAPTLHVVDCGAGIGRVTKDLLTKFFSPVDIVEPVEKFTREITEGSSFSPLRDAGVIGDVYNVGLERWNPRPGAYSVIWNQWCLGHLRDHDLILYLTRCITALTASSTSSNPSTPPSTIIVKENIASGPDDIYDPQDSSVTRTEAKFKKLFKEAGLVIVREEVMRGVPPKLGLYKVKTFALRPVGAMGTQGGDRDGD
ncbi:alpha-N-methyltransferase NTM1 [Kalaharituber pfeilii]|nr:alpha-N-methyltransferase NTM1 [Kalaharituber pfeilii]